MSLEPIIRRLRGTLDQRLESTRPSAQMLVFAAIGTILISLSFFLTRSAVEDHRYQRLMKSLQDLIPETATGSWTLSEATQAAEVGRGKSRLSLFHLNEGGNLRGYFLKGTTAEGYSGDIEFVMGVRPDGRIIGVRVIDHRETPGLGDWIESSRSGWILRFNGKSLDDPREEFWHVRKDGGTFDQFTGATITPRAVVRGVHDALIALKAYENKKPGEPLK